MSSAGHFAVKKNPLQWNTSSTRPPFLCTIYSALVSSREHFLSANSGSANQRAPSSAAWQMCKDMELATVEGYVFQHSSITPRIRSLKREQKTSCKRNACHASQKECNVSNLADWEMKREQEPSNGLWVTSAVRLIRQGHFLNQINKKRCQLRISGFI